MTDTAANIYDTKTEPRKGILHTFWTTPYPDFFRGILHKVFLPLEERVRKKELKDTTYLILEIIVIAAMIAVIIMVTGIFNPLDLMFDVPYLGANDYLGTIENYNNYTWTTYFAFSGSIAMIVLYLMQAFVFRGKTYKLLSVHGLLFAVMAVLIAVVCDMLFQDAFRVFHETYITDNIMAPWNLASYLLANVTVYYVLADALGSALSFSITPVLCKYLGINLFSMGLIHFIAMALILKLIMTLIDKIGVWEKIVAFIAKWIYTPKYLIRIILFLYAVFLIIPIRLAFPDFYKKMKARFLR